MFIKALKDYRKYLKQKKIKETEQSEKLNKLYAEFMLFKTKSKGSRFKLDWENRYPCFDDATKQTTYEPQYTLHPAWAARILKRLNPEKHVDISSHLASMAVLSAFIPIDFYDYRPADIELDNLNSKQADLLHLPFKDNSIFSLSCMHVVEHVGLGRYGDEINPEADLIAISELKRVLAQNGSLLFVVPVCHEPMVKFNGHRYYSHQQIMDYFSEFSLENFSLILPSKNSGKLISNPSESIMNDQFYGCGCYWFKKTHERRENWE